MGRTVRMEDRCRKPPLFAVRSEQLKSDLPLLQAWTGCPPTSPTATDRCAVHPFLAAALAAPGSAASVQLPPKANRPLRLTRAWGAVVCRERWYSSMAARNVLR